MIKDAEGPLPFGEEERYPVLGGRGGGKGKLNWLLQGTDCYFQHGISDLELPFKACGLVAPYTNGQKWTSLPRDFCKTQSSLY